MTGGVVVVLGPTGLNFGAGMTNGAAYVYDPAGEFPDRINGESVLLESTSGGMEAAELRRLIERHVALTGSAHAQRVLADWDNVLTAFWTVIPRAAVAARAAEAEAAVEPEPARGAAD
jgi:glutamate synthase domain-containing protein 3